MSELDRVLKTLRGFIGGVEELRRRVEALQERLESMERAMERVRAAVARGDRRALLEVLVDVYGAAGLSKEKVGELTSPAGYAVAVYRVVVFGEPLLVLVENDVGAPTTVIASADDVERADVVELDELRRLAEEHLG